MFPSCLEARDVDMLAKREDELSKTYRYGGYTFLAGYGLLSIANIIGKGRLPYFRNFMKHSILAGTGTVCSALAVEKIAAEVYYNKILIQLADKYNFTPEEVLDLQRNLNAYYIKKDRDADMARD